MKRITLVVGLAALMLGATVSVATATHPHPGKSGKVQVEFVAAYNQCTVPTATHRPALALPACSSPVTSTSNNAANVMDFAKTGAISSMIQAKNGDVALKGKGKGILNNTAPFTGNATAVATVRATDGGCGPGPSYGVDCTIIDFPFPVTVVCTAGKCALNTSANTVVPGAVNSGDASNIEIGQVQINDPDGDAAARQGVYVK